MRIRDLERLRDEPGKTEDRRDSRVVGLRGLVEKQRRACSRTDLRWQMKLTGDLAALAG